MKQLKDSIEFFGEVFVTHRGKRYEARSQDEWNEIVEMCVRERMKYDFRKKLDNLYREVRN